MATKNSASTHKSDQQAAIVAIDLGGQGLPQHCIALVAPAYFTSIEIAKHNAQMTVGGLNMTAMNMFAPQYRP